MAALMESLIFVGIFLGSCILLKLRRDKTKPRYRCPPSLPSLPIIGSLPFMRGFDNIAEFLMQKADELGPVFTFRAGSKTVLTLNSREVLEEALVNNSYAFSGRDPIFTEGIVNPHTKGLSSMNTSPEFKKYQHLSLSILKEFGFGVKSTMEARILLEVESMIEYIKKQNGVAFDPRELAMLASSNVINNIMLGRRREYELGASELAHQTKQSFEGLDNIFDIAPIVRFLPYYAAKLRLHVQSERKIQEILAEEVKECLTEGAPDCYVRMYVEKLGRDCDREQLNFTLRDLVGAGTDTTGNTFLWGLIALANYPRVQQRLQEEIDKVIPRDRLPSIDDQPKLPFVQAVILEIMRWKTLAIISIPRITLADSEIQGYIIPVGTVVWPNIYAAHMDSQVWKDPDAFRPERFLDEKNNIIDKNRVIPFSIGRRSCLGEVLARHEIFLLFTGLLQRFLIQPPDGQNAISVDTDIGVLAVPSPFMVRLIPRPLL